MTKLPLVLSVPPVTLSPRDFSTGIASPGDHGFVDRAGAFSNRPVHRHALAGPNAKPVASLDAVKRNVFARGRPRYEQMGLLWREIQQRANGAGGLLTGSQLQHLAEQNECSDHRCGLKINWRAAVHRAEGDWKNLREDCGHDAIEIGGAGAEADQREHVRAAVNQRGPEALEERPAAPQDDGRREDEFNPVANAWSEMQTEVIAEHG